MEATSPLDNDFRQELGITGDINSYLSETAKWAKFLSIIGFIFLGLMVLMGISMGSLMSSFADLPTSDEIPFNPTMFSGIFTVLYLLFAILYFFPTLYLYRFSSQMQMALKNSDQSLLTNSFSNLKSVFKFWGIFTALIVGLYVVMFVFGILGGIAAIAM